jgi:hypothetical protein
MTARQFRVVAPMGVTIPEGVVLDLTPEQAKPRTHNLYRVADGHLVEGPVMFKAGDVFGVVQGHINKLFLGGLEEVSDAVAPDEAPTILASVAVQPNMATSPVRRSRKTK